MRQLRVSSATNPQSLHPVSSWRRLCREGQEVNSSRSVYHPGDHYPLHRHDYGECTIIIHGSIALTQATNEQELNRGSVVLIHPDFEHGFHNRGNTACELVNIAFPLATLKDMEDRYAHWTWGNAQRAVHAQLSNQSLSAINYWPEELKQDRNNRLKADACLLHIQSQLDATDHDALPAWFRDAIITFEHPPHIGMGVPELVRLCGRSREHCSRIMREKRGITLRDFVNERRLAMFCQLLEQEDSSIEHLSTQVWHNSPTQLFRLFKDKYGTSPAQWRRKLRQK